MYSHDLPIAQRIGWLMEHARRRSQAYSGPEASLARQRHLARHTSAVATLRMEGRINLAAATHTPLGIVQPFRNLGGMFDFGWPYLGEVHADYTSGRSSSSSAPATDVTRRRPPVLAAKMHVRTALRWKRSRPPEPRPIDDAN